MEDYIDINDFCTQESEDGDHPDGDYDGEIEIRESFEIKSSGSNIQNVNVQSFFQESYIKRIKSGQRIDQEEMRQWLVQWVTTRFVVCLVIGLIALVITKDGVVLNTILSSTGLFLILLALIFRHYFQRPKK